MSQGWSFVLTEEARLLVADDDPILREFAAVQLATPTASVETVPDGEAAWLRLKAEAFDLALIDIEMPKLDGFALVERIRADARLRHLPVVMLTGREDIASIDRAYRIGATSFVTKPVNWRQLSHQLRYVLRTSRLEADLRATTARAEEASRLKSNLLNVLRHEFRTPLNSIIGFADLLANPPLGDSEANRADHARYIGDSGRQLLSMFSEMMALAELGSLEVKLQEDVYGLAKLVDLAVASVQPRARERGAAIETVWSMPDLDLVCDREQCLRMIRHLLHNAVVHGGGAVQIKLSQAASGDLVIEIVDSGPGIEPQRLSACLEAFEQGDMGLTRASSGLGLGLPLAKRIATLHGGELQVEGRAGQGTCARVVLPAARVARSARAGGAETGPAARRSAA